HNGGTELFLPCEILLIDLELDKRAFHRRPRLPADFAPPNRFVEKDVFAEIFCINKSEIAFGADEFDHPEPTALDEKTLLGRVVLAIHCWIQSSEGVPCGTRGRCAALLPVFKQDPNLNRP